MSTTPNLSLPENPKKRVINFGFSGLALGIDYCFAGRDTGFITGAGRYKTPVAEKK